MLRKEGGRGLASIEDSVDASIQRLEDYIQKVDGGLITAIRNDTDNTMDNRMTITRQQKWEGKQLYGRFKRLINNISHDKTWTQKEYKTRHIGVRKVIHWEICKKSKFDHAIKWYMHNPAAVLENNTQKLLWDFDIHTDHLISARRSDLIIINKKRELAKLWTLLSRLTTE